MSAVSSPDYDELARLLGVSRSVFPSDEPEPVVASENPARRQQFEPLTDAEYAAIEPFIPPLPVPRSPEKTSNRTYLESALWHIESHSRGCGWHRLPDDLGPRSSRENRWARWAMWGYWQDLFPKLRADSTLSEARLSQFERIAAAAAVYRDRVLARRAHERAR